MTSMASSNGALRIFSAGRIPYPVGDPGRPEDEEKQWRRGVVEKAAATLAESLEAAKVFA